MPRKKREPQTTLEVSPGVFVALGEAVSYYRNGWRVGHLESIDGKVAKIQPAGNHRPFNIPTEDIRKI